MTRPVQVDGPQDFATAYSVSRETLDRLENFVELLRRWQATTNLISPKTAPHIWQRHVADSAQLLALAPCPPSWLDLGSGAGFPGMVIAVLMANQPKFRMILVESNARKCAFLAEAARATRAPVKILEQRIEDVAPASIPPPGIVSARALAPLPVLLGLAAPHMAHGARGLFPKGREAQSEISAAAGKFVFEAARHPSRTDREGVILEIQGPIAMRRA